MSAQAALGDLWEVPAAQALPAGSASSSRSVVRALRPAAMSAAMPRSLHTVSEVAEVGLVYPERKHCRETTALCEALPETSRPTRYGEESVEGHARLPPAAAGVLQHP